MTVNLVLFISYCTLDQSYSISAIDRKVKIVWAKKLSFCPYNSFFLFFIMWNVCQKKALCQEVQRTTRVNNYILTGCVSLIKVTMHMFCVFKNCSIHILFFTQPFSFYPWDNFFGENMFGNKVNIQPFTFCAF